MPSTIDPSTLDPANPTEVNATTASVRANEQATQNNFTAARDDFDGLETTVSVHVGDDTIHYTAAQAAGDGLVATGNVLAVNAGDGLTTSADFVLVDTTVQRQIAGGVTGNFVSRDASGDIQDSGSAAADFEVAGAVAAHEADPDPHPQYLEAVQDDTAPILGGELQTKGQHIRITRSDDKEVGRIVPALAEDLSALVWAPDGVYSDFDGAVAVGPGVSQLRGSQTIVKSLVNTTIGGEQVYASVDGNLFTVAPGAPGWGDNDTSVVDGAIGAGTGTGAWVTTGLIVTIQQDVNPTDVLTFTYSCYVNETGGRDGGLDFDMGVDAGQPSGAVDPKSLSADYLGVISGSIAMTGLTLTAGQTVTLYIRTARGTHASFAASLLGSVQAHTLYVSVPGEGGGGGAGTYNEVTKDGGSNSSSRRILEFRDTGDATVTVTDDGPGNRTIIEINATAGAGGGGIVAGTPFTLGEITEVSSTSGDGEVVTSGLTVSAVNAHIGNGAIHVDHSVVSVTAGDGLSGGGTIAATRTIDVDATVQRRISGGTDGNLVSRDASGDVADSGYAVNDGVTSTSALWTSDKVSSDVGQVQFNLTTHEANEANPHAVTAPQVGAVPDVGTADGDVLVYDGTSWVKIGLGTAGQVLTSQPAAGIGAKVLWEPVSGGGGGTVTMLTTHTFAIGGEMTVAMPIARHFVDEIAGQSVTLTTLRHVIESGTSVTIGVTKNGTLIPGWTGFIVTQTPGGGGGAEEALAPQDYLSLVIEAASGAPTLGSITMVLRHVITVA